MEVAYSRRTSDIVYDRYNSSVILSATNLSTPSAERITASDLFDGLEVMFGFDISHGSQALDISSSNSELLMTLAATFSALSQMPYPQASGISVGGQAYTYFVAILTMPVLLFQPTWVNPYYNITPLEPEAGLPPDLYISVDLSKQIVRAIIPKWTVIVYLIVSLAVYFWCIGGMFLSSFIQTPPSTPFELIDFSSRVVSNHDETSLSQLLAETWSGNSDTIREKLEGSGLYLRNVGFSESDEGLDDSRRRAKIGFTSETKGMIRLDRKRNF